MKTLSTPDDVIKMFGGPAKTARWAGVTDNAVIWWRKRGLPPSIHVRLLVEAGRRGFQVGKDLFDLPDEDWADLQAIVRCEFLHDTSASV